MLRVDACYITGLSVNTARQGRKVSKLHPRTPFPHPNSDPLKPPPPHPLLLSNTVRHWCNTIKTTKNPKLNSCLFLVQSHPSFFNAIYGLLHHAGYDCLAQLISMKGGLHPELVGGQSQGMYRRTNTNTHLHWVGELNPHWPELVQPPYRLAISDGSFQKTLFLTMRQFGFVWILEMRYKANFCRYLVNIFKNHAN